MFILSICWVSWLEEGVPITESAKDLCGGHVKFLVWYKMHRKNMQLSPAHLSLQALGSQSSCNQAPPNDVFRQLSQSWVLVIQIKIL